MLQVPDDYLALAQKRELLETGLTLIPMHLTVQRKMIMRMGG
jgi:hypothetical protein